ncbi:MAG TPA: sodium:solute symporter family protein [Nevskiaceae bacterium]|nr:sodium:solute symporter family protein [Nevskiaceae bacterium]
MATVKGMEFNWTTLGVFAAFFIVVSALGFVAARWRRGNLNQISEWGLGGRRFGSFVTWFLLGGDLYTAYTIIAVPALVYAAGALGFFAVPYTIIIYPFLFLVFPRLWNVCRRHDWVTSADFAEGRYGSKPLALAIAVTGVIATMPYIALQLVGLEVVFQAMGLGTLGIGKETPLLIAFAILALYTWSSGLRAPAMIAFVKDAMLWIAVLAAVIIIPIHLGGYGAIFHAAQQAFDAAGKHGSILLKPQQYWAFSTLAIGSALALFLYPHSTTGILAASGPNVIRRNAIWLPLYSIMLILVSVLGYMVLASHLTLSDNNMAAPALFAVSFPPWFTGFCFAAIALGALVPAAIMSIGAANLFTRNIWKAYINPHITEKHEALLAKNVSFLVKFGALLAVLFLPTKFAIDLQLLGGIWILQILPAVICGLYTRWLHGSALLAGWAVGIVLGSGLAWARHLSPIFPIHLGGTSYGIYIALIALVANFAVAIPLTMVSRRLQREDASDATTPAEYRDVATS